MADAAESSNALVQEIFGSLGVVDQVVSAFRIQTPARSDGTPSEVRPCLKFPPTPKRSVELEGLTALASM